MNDWLSVMLEEIRRKQREREEASQERAQRERVQGERTFKPHSTAPDQGGDIPEKD